MRKLLIVLMMLISFESASFALDRGPRGRRIRTTSLVRKRPRTPRVARTARRSRVDTRSSGGSVYLCMGSGSYAYHRTPNCRAFSRCSTNPKKVSESKARSMGRSPCGWCY